MGLFSPPCRCLSQSAGVFAFPVLVYLACVGLSRGDFSFRFVRLNEVPPISGYGFFSLCSTSSLCFRRRGLYAVLFLLPRLSSGSPFFTPCLLTFSGTSCLLGFVVLKPAPYFLQVISFFVDVVVVLIVLCLGHLSSVRLFSPYLVCFVLGVSCVAFVAIGRCCRWRLSS